jgi:hypothetical protein
VLASAVPENVVLKRDRYIFSYLKAEREQRLPCILSKGEVSCILEHLLMMKPGFRRPYAKHLNGAGFPQLACGTIW